jgi:glycosyltransferase involved in cell wall biosynthesis
MNPTILSVFDIEPFRIGGLEMFAREMSTQLAEHGWDSVLCFASPPPEAVCRYLKLPNIVIEVVPEPSRFGWYAIRTLSRILRRYRPQIIHLHFTPFVSPYPWLARLHGVEQVHFTDHWSRPADYVPERVALWKRLVFSLVNLPINIVISVSNYNGRCLTATGLMAEKRVRVIYNAVDLSRADRHGQQAAIFRRKHSIPAACPLVVQVSWIRPEKGLRDLLEAARLVLARNPDVHFAFIGEGPHREQYTQQTREMGLEDRVTWTGLVMDPVAEGGYDAADVVCQVSRWQEAFGWTIVEAMSRRKPLVATRVGAIPELVEDGETGFLVSPGDSNSIAEKILRLLQDRDLRNRMGAAGRSAVELKFNLKANVTELLQLYGANSLVSRASR